MPSARWRPIAALAPLAAVALLLGPSASRAVLLGDATSIPSLMCVSVLETLDPIAAPVDYACDRLWLAAGDVSGPSRATASTGFGDPLTASVHAECSGAPHEVSTSSASRIKFQVAVAQLAAPPAHVSFVPVVLSTAGDVAVSELGMLAGGGTFVSSTESTIFSNADVFAHSMLTASQSGPVVLEDGYDIVQTIDLAPDQAYFANVYAGCNISRPGTWACDGHATVSFHLDQARFDELMGANSFDLAQFFAVQRSPNLVPEPDAALLGLTSLTVLAMRARSAA